MKIKILFFYLICMISYISIWSKNLMKENNDKNSFNSKAQSENKKNALGSSKIESLNNKLNKNLKKSQSSAKLSVKDTSKYFRMMNTY